MAREVTEVTVAYVMIKTEIGKAAAVAAAVTSFEGVDRAVVVTGFYDVIAIVEVEDNVALGQLVLNQIHGIEGVTETATAVMASWYRGGEEMWSIDNGPP